MAKETTMKKVFICSPFGVTDDDKDKWEQEISANIRKASKACRYAVLEGYIPYQPHLFFPHFMNESDEVEHEMSFILGLSWLAQCDEMWVIGKTITDDMMREIEQAEKWGIKIVHCVGKRAPEQRLLDAIFHPEISFREMD
ncbi:MAG: hypothetical protein J6A79_16815 [Clostridia bacterium]|nr:hypothetical protein [Clostridia bacterium]